MKIDRLCPTIAAIAAATWSSSPPPTTKASTTATMPLRTSSRPEASAARGPSARMTLAPPVRPLPIVRGSGPPVALAMTTPQGMPPMRYAITMTAAPIAIAPTSIGREYRAAYARQSEPAALGQTGLRESVRAAAEPGSPFTVGDDVSDEIGEARVDPCPAPDLCRRTHDGAVEPLDLRWSGIRPCMQPQRRFFAAPGPTDDPAKDRLSDRGRHPHREREEARVDARQRDRSDSERAHHGRRLLELAALDAVAVPTGIDLGG